MRFIHGATCLLSFGLIFLVLSGCGSDSNRDAATGSNSDPGGQVAEADPHDDTSHVHGEWWCSEHGVPEEECALCNTVLVAEFKSKGDWCEEHDRPESQCFLCHPENFEKFAARYEAKYGERPPQPTE